MIFVATIWEKTMIHSLAGIVVSKKKQSISLLIGPVGIDIFVPDESLFAVEKQQIIYAYLHWNQEQGPSLYGFQKELEKVVFLLIIGCSGIGPRIGLAVLADLGAQEFLDAVYTGNEKSLSKVSGIGAKKAEQMIVYSKHKVDQLLKSGIAVASSGDHVQWNMVTDALHALSYSRTEITQAVNFVRHNNKDGSSQSFDRLMRQALSFLSKHP